ncbi:hypothetical protein FCH33_14015 [Serratia fonticola]|uniref:hypothetical protein n=1 Tax=Serratia fonticola TaxID=47917 RepID=UPI0015763302|nr:hypothetical protein [Serratia fonticola]NTY87899.1 hypothetical protein [Serratia fonticola]NTZ13615.1 hypothetical protein [Serratia fonticola]
MSYLDLHTTGHRRRALPLASLIAAALMVPLSGQACGPDFPNRLLVNRNGTLLYMPEGNFAFEATRLVPVDPQLPRWQAPAPATPPKPMPLSPEQQAITQMRATQTVEEADAVNAQGLSNAARLYTLGAVAFAAEDPRASQYFQQVLALPAAEQEAWGLRAQYSLGRLLMGDHGTPENESGSEPVVKHPEKAQLEQALAAFQQVIDQVKSGTADPDQLALSSLGQQARIHLWLGEIAPAAQLYAQQAAQGDPDGGLSLQYTSTYLVNPQHVEALKQAIHDPLVQQLVTIELFARSSNLEMSGIINGETGVKQLVAQTLTLLNDSVKSGFTGSDRLAALAYRSGQYAMAANLLKNAGDGGLAWWLRAKMALRDGDVKAATAAYAKAAAAFPTDESWGEQRNEDFAAEMIVPDCRVAGEQAILALNRGDYLQAMDLMYRGKENYWADVADIAERVLTVDELKGFVDKHAPAPTTPLKPVKPDEYNGERITQEVQLRELLARRMMRAGRYEEAVNYFAIPNYRQAAQDFANLMKAAKDKSADKNARAKSYYQAAALLRSQGLDFTGYEMTPDYNIYGAGYSYLGDAFNTKDIKDKSWISAAEAARAKKSLPDADNRFLHYRWQAVDLAQKAADLLPPKSQAYAAVLCNAAGWVIARDAKTGRALYQRYIKNGTQFEWGTKFGYNCPAPEFDTATN